MQNLTPSQNKNQPTSQTQAEMPPENPSSKRRFDLKTWQQLDGYDFHILDHMIYLSKLQAKRSPTGAAYCYPSQQYLANKLGCRREAVNRHIQKLAKLGVLEITHRRSIKGIRQTNVYKVCKWIIWRLKAVFQPLRSRSKPCAPRRTHSTPNGVNNNIQTLEGAPTAIKSTLMSLFERLKRGESIEET